MMPEEEKFDCPRCGVKDAITTSKDEVLSCSNSECRALVVIVASDGVRTVQDTQDTLISSKGKTTSKGISWGKIGNVAISSVAWDNEISRDQFYSKYSQNSVKVERLDSYILKPSILLVILTLLTTAVLAIHSQSYVRIFMIAIGIVTMWLQMRYYFYPKTADQ